MFLFEGRGKTDREPIRNEQFCVKLVDAFLHTLKSRREGVFEIDLRLRPHGRAGSLAVSLAAFREYFAPHGAAWPFERQALVKLRPVWGDASFGEEVVRSRDELIYSGEAFDTVAMRGMRERQLRQTGRAGRFNAKLGPAGWWTLNTLCKDCRFRTRRRTRGCDRPTRWRRWRRWLVRGWCRPATRTSCGTRSCICGD